jgi:hypothetical protein
MDDGMRFEEFTKYHKDLQSISDDVIVVNGRYATDCMTYGLILAHNQRVYQVQGHSTPQAESTKPKSSASEPSLPAANTTKVSDEYLQHSMTDQQASRRTTERYETQKHYPIVGLISKHARPKKLLPLTFGGAVPQSIDGVTAYNDDLSTMIYEAKATAHLVSQLPRSLKFLS